MIRAQKKEEEASLDELKCQNPTFCKEGVDRLSWFFCVQSHIKG